MHTPRILIGAFLVAALGSTEVQAWDIGYVGDDGYTFIYDEQQEAPYATGWWGKDTGNFNDKAEVQIRADGKTSFEGTLLITCGTLEMQWTQVSEYSNTGSVPSDVWQKAGGLFCSN